MIIKSNLNISNIKCLILDIDDTLVTWERMNEFYKEAVTSFKIPYKNEYCDILNHSFEAAESIGVERGKATEEIYASSHEKFLTILKEYGISGMDFAKRMMSLEKKYVCSTSDIKETLKILSKHFNLVCLTNWFLIPAKEKLEQKGLLKYIEKIYSYEDIFPKPNKQGIQLILNDYKLRNEEVIIIGDSTRETETAINGNIKCILVDYKKEKQFLWEKADVVITKISDIIELLDIKDKEE